MHSRVEGLSRLEHAIGHMEELAHHGADDEHRRLAVGGQAQTEELAPVGPVEGHHGWHVEGLAQEGMADLGHARLGSDAAARLMLSRVEAGKGHRLADVVEARQMSIEGQQHGDGPLPQTGDGVEQTLLVAQRGITIDMVVDRLDQPFDLLVQPFEMAGDTGLDRGAGHLQAVGLLRAHRLQGIEAQHQGAQSLLGRRGGSPSRRAALEAKLGDQLGIDLVGLGAHHVRGTEGLDLRRIDHTDGGALATGETLRHGLPIGAGGLHADMHRVGALLGKPLAQRRKAGGGVLDHLVTELAVGQTQGAVELGLGHIDTQVEQVHRLSSRDRPCECGLPASRAKDTVRSVCEGERRLQGSTQRARGPRAQTASRRSTWGAPQVCRPALRRPAVASSVALRAPFEATRNNRENRFGTIGEYKGAITEGHCAACAGVEAIRRITPAANPLYDYLISTGPGNVVPKVLAPCSAPAACPRALKKSSRPTPCWWASRSGTGHSRAAHAAGSTLASSTAASASRRMRSPARTLPSGPPATHSGVTWMAAGTLPEAPDMRPSVTRATW